MKVRTIVLALLTTAALATPALAQDRNAPPTTGNNGVTEFTFLDDNVRGEGVAPDGEIMRVRRGRFVGSLIRPRTHFAVELRRSIEKL